MMRVREEKQQYNTTYLFDHVCHDPCIFHQWIWVQFIGPCKPQNPYKQGHHRHNSVEMIIFGAATITLLFSMRPGPLRECDLGFPVRRSWWYLFQSILCHVHHPPANKPGHTLHSCACLLRTTKPSQHTCLLDRNRSILIEFDSEKKHVQGCNPCIKALLWFQCQLHIT